MLFHFFGFFTHLLSEVVTKPPRLFQTASLSALYHARGVLSKNAALGVRRRATGGGFLIIYKVGDCFFRSGGFRRLRAASAFPSDGKGTKGSPGDAADGHFVPIGPLSPGSPFTGVIPWSGQSISGAQNLSDDLNPRRATGPCLPQNCNSCDFTTAPGVAEQTRLVQNTDTSSAPFGGTFP